jgi:hypothetical protein
MMKSSPFSPGSKPRARSRTSASARLARVRRLYPLLTTLGEKTAHASLSRILSHGAEPGRPHSRARLRNLDRARLRGWTSGSALACGRAGNLGESGNLSGRQQRSAAEAEEEPPTTFSCENIQNSEGGQLKVKKGQGFAEMPETRGITT